MTPEQRARLAEGRAAFRQRWLAERYLAALAPATRGALSRARVVTRPESDAALGYRLFDERGLGRDEITRPTGYRFLALSRQEEVPARVEEFGAEADELTGDFCPTYFVARQDDEWYSSGEPPVFEVRFGWARAHFAELYAAANHGCNLTTRCGRAGILTRVVHGYRDRPADEPVFELAYWIGDPSGPSAAADGDSGNDS